MSIDDLKEFVKHLRSIHFAMVITSGAILLGISGGGSIYDSALVQLRDVNRLDEQLTSQFIATSLKKELSTESVVSGERQATKLENLLSLTISDFFESSIPVDEIRRVSVASYELFVDERNVEYDIPDAFLWFDSHLAILSNGSRNYFGSHDLPVYGNSLRDKRGSLDQILAADTLFVNPTFIREFHYPGSVTFDRNASAITLIEEKLQSATDISIRANMKALSLTDQDARSRYKNALGVIEEDPIGYEQFDGPFDNFSLSLRFQYKQANAPSTERFSVDFEMPFMFTRTSLKFIGEQLKEIDSSDEVYPRYLNGARSTTELFPELNQVTEYFSSADYADIEQYLKQQVAEKNTPINVFGLNINSQLVAIWGVVLLLCVQLYFCVHYKTFVEHYPKEKTWVFPWIAMYRDKTSMFIFQLSLLLPVVVCTVMLFTRGQGIFYVRWLFLAVAILGFYWSERIYLKYLDNRR